MAWPTTVRTWLAGETVTAAKMNEVRDALKAVGDPWASYTPTWAAATNPTIGNGSITGRYSAAGKRVSFRVAVAFGSTTTFGSGAMTLTLPVAPATGQRFFFGGYVYVGTALYVASGHSNGTTTINLYTSHPSTVGQYSALTSASPVAMVAAAGNGLYLNGTYEAL